MGKKTLNNIIDTLANTGLYSVILGLCVAVLWAMVAFLFVEPLAGSVLFLIVFSGYVIQEVNRTGMAPHWMRWIWSKVWRKD